MRADRLVAILLMLQRRGVLTAAQVAEELEISERTARRDLDALGAAGIPVYSQQGRNGGWRLLGEGTTDLTGLSAAEVRALFLVAGPAAGATKDVKAALRKLVSALPEPFRDQAEIASNAILIDPAPWNTTSAVRLSPPLLDEVQDALVTERQIEIGYVARDGLATIRVVHPLGLAAKGAVWYLVADTDSGLRTFRVDRMRSVRATGERAVRPVGFVLSDAWALITATVNDRRMPASTRIRTDPGTARMMRYVFGARLSVGRPEPQPQPLVEVELVGQSLDSLACEIAGFGSAIDVISPMEVRQQLYEIGLQLVDAYGEAGQFGQVPTVP